MLTNPTKQQWGASLSAEGQPTLQKRPYRLGGVLTANLEVGEEASGGQRACVPGTHLNSGS